MITLSAAAAKLGMSTARLRLLCTAERVPGAKKIGRDWFTPDEPRVKAPKHRGRPPHKGRT